MRRDETMKLISWVLIAAALLWGVLGFTYLFAGDKLIGGGFIIGALTILIVELFLIRGRR